MHNNENLETIKGSKDRVMLYTNFVSGIRHTPKVASCYLSIQKDIRDKITLQFKWRHLIVKFFS